MRFLLLFGVLAFSLGCWPCFGQRLSVRPVDFQPLTELPWNQPEETAAPLEKMLERIFLESDTAIRHAVLSAYLHRIPVEDFPRAFDLCITLQGTQWPNELVALMLPIWAERDPKTAWKHAQSLFPLVAFGWLDLDSWGNPKIKVSDLAVLQKSSFWLLSGLESFPRGIDRSNLSRPERIVLLGEFASQYLAVYGHLPYIPDYESTHNTYEDVEALMRGFALHPPEFKTAAKDAAAKGHEEACEIILRRWLVRSPQEAGAIFAFAQQLKWPPEQRPNQINRYVVSAEWLLLWAKTDLSGMIAWAETLDLAENDLSTPARAVLLGFADPKTCRRWLAEAKARSTADEDLLHTLLEQAAPWAPQLALEEAVATANAEIIRDVAEGMAYGFQSESRNTSHFGLGIVNDFQLTKLHPSLLAETRTEWGITIMELWGDIDVAEAARYGFRFLSQAGVCPRENLIKLFAGDDEYSSDSDMIDRTFCALRTWAVLQPGAMKAWIAQQEGADMREALTWLLNHPWGTGEPD